MGNSNNTTRLLRVADVYELRRYRLGYPVTCRTYAVACDVRSTGTRFMKCELPNCIPFYCGEISCEVINYYRSRPSANARKNANKRENTVHVNYRKPVRDAKSEPSTCAVAEVSTREYGVRFLICPFTCSFSTRIGTFSHWSSTTSTAFGQYDQPVNRSRTCVNFINFVEQWRGVEVPGRQDRGLCSSKCKS